ncbi:MAG: hypothetical protein ABR906_06625 [Terracidiphilus sp.]|jgi:hypothetical protein
MKAQLRVTALWFAVILLATSSGCHSYHIDTTIENRTGGPIRLLEVDYPSATFGANNLAAGESFHYRIQLRGAGPLKVQYTANDGLRQAQGPMLAEPQEGRIEIVLLPEGKAEFHRELSDAVVRVK